MKNSKLSFVIALALPMMLHAGQYFCPTQSEHAPYLKEGYLNKVTAKWIFLRNYNVTGKRPASKHLIITCHYSDDSQTTEESPGGAQRHFNVEFGGNIVYTGDDNHYAVEFSCEPDEETRAILETKGRNEHPDPDIDEPRFQSLRDQGVTHVDNARAGILLRETSEIFSHQCGLYSIGGSHESNRKNLWAFLCENTDFSSDPAHSVACSTEHH